MDKKKIFKNIIMFCSYFLYQIIPLFIIDILNIDTSNWNIIQKNIYLTFPSLLFLIFIIIIYKNELKNDCNKMKGNFINTILKYFPYYLFGVLAMAISNMIITNVTGTALSENEVSVREYIKLFPLYMSFSTVIFAPITEEIVFRKIFRNLIENNFVFVITSGAIFGLVHMSTGTFTDFLTIVPYIIMGINLSYIYYKSDNILTTMTLHSLHNFILLLMQFIGG